MYSFHGVEKENDAGLCVYKLFSLFGKKLFLILLLKNNTIYRLRISNVIAIVLVITVQTMARIVRLYYS